MMRRNGLALRELLLVVVVIMILAAIFQPLVNRSPDGGRRSICQSNLKKIALACAVYFKDYDDRFPLISNGGEGWANTMELYGNGWNSFQCPRAIQPSEIHSTDYFLNARVAGLARKRIPFGSQTILFGEGIDNGATNSHFSELPLDWKTTENSPARRHLDGANYAFVDGHVKWLKPIKIAKQPFPSADGSDLSFAIR